MRILILGVTLLLASCATGPMPHSGQRTEAPYGFKAYCVRNPDAAECK